MALPSYSSLLRTIAKEDEVEDEANDSVEHSRIMQEMVEGKVEEDLMLEDGKEMVKCLYINNQLNGLYIRYYQDGRREFEGMYKNDLKDVQILSYAVKFSSSFYGPFRDAVGSKKLLKGDKKTYQMDFRNSNESLREVSLDIKEGTDMIMVKPGMPYLDIIKKVKDNFKIPVFAYQVSGEYSLIMNGINKKLIDKESIKESLISFKRAGASSIVTYFADQIDL